MKINRRRFLQLLAGTPIAATMPAFAVHRNPYVQTGQVVDHIGPAGRGEGFIGGQLVTSVGEWDGVGFPVVTLTNGFPGEDDIYYDIDLADFLREVPAHFWQNPENRKKYPNVHTYVREQRYGETVHEAIKALNYYHTAEWLQEF